MNNEINKQKINASALYKLITKEMVYEVKEQLLASGYTNLVGSKS